MIINFLICLFFCVLKTSVPITAAAQNSDDNIITCLINKLVVKGNRINMSDILKIACLKNAKFVELFALDTLIIDEDFVKTGERVQLSIIAPKWKIVGKRKIILDGHQKQPLTIDYAASGIGRFKDGKPGKPGDSAGCFLGIGVEFIDESNLEIHVNGGVGGPGQFGGNGTKLFYLYQTLK